MYMHPTHSMMHAHIYPYTRMQDTEMPHTLTHAYYMHDIRIQNRDARTDSQNTYIHHPLTCRAQTVRWWSSCSDGEQYSAVVWAGVLGTTQEWCTETQHAITICMEVFNVTSSCTCPIPYTCTQSANYQSSIHKVQQMSLELLHHQIKTLQTFQIQYIYTLCNTVRIHYIVHVWAWTMDND